jgi:hypothetical protein
MLLRPGRAGWSVEALFPEFVAEGAHHGRDDGVGHFHVEQKPVGVGPVALGLAFRHSG